MIRQARALRRTASCFASVIALAGLFLICKPAHAASVDACTSQLGELDRVLPEGVNDLWAKIVQEELDKINAMSDADSLMAGLNSLQADYEAYQANPDPDGDGYARDPAVMDAETVLYVCFYEARAAELSLALDDEAGDEPLEAAEEDVEVDYSSRPTPIGDPGDWFADVAYPASAANAGRSGVVRYDVTVAADGSVAGCQASGPPDSADLELATCDAVMAYAHFTPATDRAGAPVVSEISGTMRWVIP